jgi:hypothetical protein
MEIKIEKGIPVPKAKGGRKARFPFREMTIGDSVFFGQELAERARNAATLFARYNPEYKFTSRREENGVRIWRIEVQP